MTIYEAKTKAELDEAIKKLPSPLREIITHEVVGTKFGRL